MIPPAMPAAEPRPTNGARTKATEPAARAIRPSQAAKPKAAPPEMASPGRLARLLPAIAVAVPMIVMASATIRTWPSTFSQATRRRLIGAASRMSRLPRRVSAASVPERARIDQRPITSGRKPPYLYWRYPPSVSTLTGFPAKPCMIGGTASTMLPISSRASAVPNWLTIPAETAKMSSPTARPTMIVDRRESRSVLPNTLPRPKARLNGEGRETWIAGAVMTAPRRPAAGSRTRPGRSLRATALGSRSRPARTVPRHGRPGSSRPRRACGERGPRP